jgi:large subunit ribosomal protein L24
MSRIRKNDTVIVIAGKDKGRSGQVLKVTSDGKKVLVEKLNIARRHQRPTQANPQGGIVDKEMPIDASNVMLLTKDNRAVRVGIQVDESGNKVRIARQTGEAL